MPWQLSRQTALLQAAGEKGSEADGGTAAPCGRNPLAGRRRSLDARWNPAGEPRLRPVTRLLRSLYLVPQAGAQGYLTAGLGSPTQTP